MAVTVAWNTEAFSRTKQLKPLDTYLNPPKPKSAESGSADLRAMIARMAEKQGT
jgi:hypothetical protein